MSPDVEDILDRAKGSSRVGDHEEAERLLKQYIAKVPDDRSAHLLLGTTLAKEEKLDEAADEFTTLLAKNPQDVEALNNLAVIYRRQDKLQDALAVLLDAIEIDPTRAEFHYNIGNINKQLGNLKSASMAYAKVVELNPDYVPAYNNLGTIYEQLREYDRAYTIFRKGLALDRNNPTLHFNYGVALEANNRFDDALNEYNAALRSKPGWLQPMNNIGIIYFKQGQHAKAMETFNRILHADPLNAEARNNMGVVQADQGRNKEAVANYRRAIEIDPKYIKAVVNLERSLEDSGDFADAMVELEKLIKLVPNSADVRHRLAALYLKMDRYPEALQQARAALEWEPENIQALRVLGATHRVMGNDAEAKKVFEKILSLDPGNYAFQLDLADIHFKRKEFKEAEARILAFLARRPNDRGAKMLLGRLYAAMGNRTHAIQVFVELIGADPGDTEALAAVAELHKDAGETEKALRTADKLVNLQGKRATSDDLTGLNESLDLYESAVKAYSSEVTEMWARNLKLLRDAISDADDEESSLALLMGMGEKTPEVDEETEAIFIEEPETEEIEEERLFLEDELPLLDEEALPDMSLDNLAENLPEPYSEPPFPEEEEPVSPGEPIAEEPYSPPPREEPPYYPQSRPEPPYYPPEPDVPRYPPPRVPPVEGPEEEEEELLLEDGGEENPREYDDSAELPLDAAPEPEAAETPAEEAELPAEEEAELEELEAIPDEAEPSEEAIPEALETDPASEPLPESEETEPDAEPNPESEEIAPEDDSDELEDLFGEDEPESVFDALQLPEDEEDLPPPEELTGADDLELPAGEEPPPEESELGELELLTEDDEAVPEAIAENETQSEAELPLQKLPLDEAETETAEPGAAVEDSLSRDSVLGLMTYLKDLSATLPEKKQETFLKSDARLSLEYVINTLKGKNGLLKGISKRVPQREFDVPAGTASSSVVSGEKIAGTLSYLENLSSSVRDQSLFTTLRQRVHSIMARIKAGTDKRQKNNG